MICRLSVQSALRDRGIGGTTPSGMINRAKSQYLISDLAHKQSEAVTFMGNKSAHPNDDELLNVGASDARQGSPDGKTCPARTVRPGQVGGYLEQQETGDVSLGKVRPTNSRDKGHGA